MCGDADAWRGQRVIGVWSSPFWIHFHSWGFLDWAECCCWLTPPQNMLDLENLIWKTSKTNMERNEYGYSGYDKAWQLDPPRQTGHLEENDNTLWIQARFFWASTPAPPQLLHPAVEKIGSKEWINNNSGQHSCHFLPPLHLPSAIVHPGKQFVAWQHWRPRTSGGNWRGLDQRGTLINMLSTSQPAWVEAQKPAWLLQEHRRRSQEQMSKTQLWIVLKIAGLKDPQCC